MCKGGHEVHYGECDEQVTSEGYMRAVAASRTRARVSDVMAVGDSAFR